MTMMGPHSTLEEVLADPRARELLGDALGDALGDLPPGRRVQPISIALLLGDVPRARAARIEADLGTVPRASGDHGPALAVDADYADPGAPASAVVRLPDTASVHRPVEIRFEGHSVGNPFVDVEFSADIVDPQGSVRRVGGFYDGNGAHLLRFLPETPGEWTFVTESNARSLAGIRGAVRVAEGTAHGVVRVADRFGFAHADGTVFVPVGTTLYAWTHQSEDLQRRTLATLEAAPFTKVRMCLFPKWYDFTHVEPELLPFARDGDGYDTTRFDPAFFRALERRIRDLDELGIQADLILFHPYDKWGFSDLGPAVDERYLRYVVRRLAAQPNVWWSLANEYDFLPSKDVDDWNRLAEVVQEEDPAAHLLSIHNGVHPFDPDSPWTTHASLQRCDSIRSTDVAVEVRRRWGRPVVFDEPGYEGDIEWEWGNVTATEVVRQFWEAMTGGTYVTHGEVYRNEREELFWSKGGELVGEAPARIAFLSEVVAASPSGRLDPIRSGLQGHVGGVAEQYEVQYLGLSQPRSLTLVVPEGRRAAIDVLDTWAMTVEPLPGIHEGTVTVPLPGRPSLAVRMRAL